MKRLRASEQGFSIVEALLILVIVALVGFVGWYVYNTGKKANATYDAAARSTPVAAAVPKTPQTTKTPVAMKTYSNDEYGFSFEYPSDWSLAVSLKDIGRQHNEGDVTVTSPNGTVVHFGPNLGGKGGDCWDEQANARTTRTCTTRNILSVTRLSTSSDAHPIYFYTASDTAPINNGGKTTYFIYDGSGDFTPTKTGSSLGVFSTYDDIKVPKLGNLTVFVEGKDDANNNSAAFFDTPEVQEATPVLKSLKFTEQ